MSSRVTLNLREDGVLELWLNELGRGLLVRELQALSEQNDHFHLMPAEWGAADIELSIVPYRETDKIIDSGKVLFRKDDWDRDYYPHVMSGCEGAKIGSDNTPTGKRMSENINSSLEDIIGEKLSAVTFVMDYWQLDFDGRRFNVTSRVIVMGVDSQIVSDGPEFRNRLCDRIGKVAISAKFITNEGVLIGFEDGGCVLLSSRSGDYASAEAILYNGPSGWWSV